MANGVDPILQGLRLSQAGFSDLGEGLQARGAAQERQAELERRREAERIKAERLRGVSSQVEGIVSQAQSPEFGREQFAEASRPITEAAIELQDPSLLRTLDPVESILRSREAERLATIQTESEQARAKRKGEEDKAKTKRQKVKDQIDLAKDFDTHATTKRTGIVSESFNRIDTLASGEPSAAKDMSMIFNFMKMLDPPSVVRESEFKNAEQARSFFSRKVNVADDGTATTENGVPVPSFLVRVIQRLDPEQQGASLTPDQRQDFQNTAESLYEAQLKSQAAVDAKFKANAEDLEVDPSRVVSTPAVQTLSELQERRKSREKSQTLERAKETTGTTAEQPKVRVISPEQASALLQSNPQLLELKAQKEAELGRPLTPEEQSSELRRILESNGVTIGGPSAE